MEDVRKMPAMTAATARSGHAVDMPYMPNATMTMMLPIA